MKPGGVEFQPSVGSFFSRFRRAPDPRNRRMKGGHWKGNDLARMENAHAPLFRPEGGGPRDRASSNAQDRSFPKCSDDPPQYIRRLILGRRGIPSSAVFAPFPHLRSIPFPSPLSSSDVRRRGSAMAHRRLVAVCGTWRRRRHLQARTHVQRRRHGCVGTHRDARKLLPHAVRTWRWKGEAGGGGTWVLGTWDIGMDATGAEYVDVMHA